jgi:alkanesulfonate monooxygenase SsuD/methylene tetrahydromethanopterin reductase-like flavin-dependent oxidoreductase (luciferase family)
MTGRALSIGVAAALGPAAIAGIAPLVEARGFTSLWVNDTPNADALAALAAAASVTSTLRLAVGVLPVDRRSPAEISAAIAGLPTDRLVIALGSGAGGPGSLDRVRDAVQSLRRTDPDVALIVGALGPKMRRLGAEFADGLLLSWLSPSLASVQAEELHDVDPAARAILYARAAVDADAVARLERESAQYASYPNYAANFRRLHLDPSETVLLPDTLSSAGRAYLDAVDELVLRAITPDDDPASLARFVDRAADLLVK